MFYVLKKRFGQKKIVPLEPPDENGRAVDFDHFGGRKRVDAKMRRAAGDALTSLLAFRRWQSVCATDVQVSTELSSMVSSAYGDR
jgi:hypothetical protein